MTKLKLLALLAAPLAASACGNDTTPASATFTSLKPTLVTSCALSNVCHNAQSNLGDGSRLDLETDPWAALVGAATRAPAYPKLKADYPTLVVAGDADKSACWVKMNLAMGHDANYGDRMPQSNLPLDAATLAKFKSWINGGAKND